MMIRSLVIRQVRGREREMAIRFSVIRQVRGEIER
jgi:hypothetical protein